MAPMREHEDIFFDVGFQRLVLMVRSDTSSPEWFENVLFWSFDGDPSCGACLFDKCVGKGLMQVFDQRRPTFIQCDVPQMGEDLCLRVGLMDTIASMFKVDSQPVFIVGAHARPASVESLVVL